MSLRGYINHSGGAIGADTYWERIGAEYGVITRSYSFAGHKSTSPAPIILSQVQLNTADEHLLHANQAFATHGSRYKRHFPTGNLYVDNLLRRNWFQVKSSTQIVAIGVIDFNANIIEGGTGWAVQMAINAHKLVYVYHYPLNAWFVFNYKQNIFVIMKEIPVLAQQFAGIGTRGEKKDDAYVFPLCAVDAIRLVYEHTRESIR